MDLLNLEAATTEQVLPFPHTFPNKLLDISCDKKITVLVHRFPRAHTSVQQVWTKLFWPPVTKMIWNPRKWPLPSQCGVTASVPRTNNVGQRSSLCSPLPSQELAAKRDPVKGWRWNSPLCVRRICTSALPLLRVHALGSQAAHLSKSTSLCWLWKVCTHDTRDRVKMK